MLTHCVQHGLESQDLQNRFHVGSPLVGIQGLGLNVGIIDGAGTCLCEGADK